MRSEIELLEDDLDEGPVVTAWELGLTMDLPSEDIEDDDDDLGFRALYEHPEAIVDSARWPNAA